MVPVDLVVFGALWITFMHVMREGLLQNQFVDHQGIVCPPRVAITGVILLVGL